MEKFIGWRWFAPAVLQSLVFATVLLLFLLFGLTGPVVAFFCGNDDGADNSCFVQADPGTAAFGTNTGQHVGNPIDILSGAKQQREIDYQAAGSPLHLSRYYYSERSDSQVGLGAGWRHSYQVTLMAVDDLHLRIQQASGRWIDFYALEQPGGQTVYMANVVRDGYIVLDDKPTWYLPDGRALRFNGSLLTYIDYPSGDQLMLKYRNKQLQSVSDNSGRSLGFEYFKPASGLPSYDAMEQGEFPGFLKQVALPSEDTIRYKYDNKRNLVDVAYAENDFKRYGYGEPSYPSYLTSIMQFQNEEATNRRWQYNSDGRVIRYDAPDIKDSLEIEYIGVVNNNGDGQTIVNYPSGRQQRHDWSLDESGEQHTVTQVVVTECDGCASLGFKPATALVQQPEDVNSKLLSNPYLTVRDNKAQNLIAASQMRSDVAGVIELKPIKNSLDSTIDLTLKDQSHQLHVHVNREGGVFDISIGNTSLNEMKYNFQQGFIERCDFEPLFQRTQYEPAPEKSCLQDLLFLIELKNDIEDQSASHGLPDIRDMLRTPEALVDGDENEFLLHCLTAAVFECAALERDFELAQLSQCAYQIQLTHCGSKWKTVPPSSLGMPDELFVDNSFASTLFRNAQTGEYVLSFRGTDDGGDWLDNLAQGSGYPQIQYQKAVILAKTLQQALPNQTISTTGHSLGGGLATTAALSIGVEANVYNTAALTPASAEKLGLAAEYQHANDLINVTTVNGDALTQIQEPSGGFTLVTHRAPGEHTMIQAPPDAWIDQQQSGVTDLIGYDGVVLHSIDAVLKSEEDMLGDYCGVTPERA